jgi:hypothetical protein
MSDFWENIGSKRLDPKTSSIIKSANKAKNAREDKAASDRYNRRQNRPGRQKEIDGIEERKQWLTNKIATEMFKNGGKILITDDDIYMMAYGENGNPGPFSSASGFKNPDRMKYVRELLKELETTGYIETRYDPSSGVTYVNNLGLDVDETQMDTVSDFGKSYHVGDIEKSKQSTLEIAAENRRTCLADNCQKAFRSLIRFFIDSDPKLTRDIGTIGMGGKRKSKKSKSKKSKTKKNRSR